MAGRSSLHETQQRSSLFNVVVSRIEALKRVLTILNILFEIFQIRRFGIFTEDDMQQKPSLFFKIVAIQLCHQESRLQVAINGTIF